MTTSNMVLLDAKETFVQKENKTCIICDNTEVYHIYSSGKTVCKECYRFFQATVNKMMGVQS